MRAGDTHNIFFIKERIKLTASATITINNNRGEPSFSGGFNL